MNEHDEIHDEINDEINDDRELDGAPAVAASTAGVPAVDLTPRTSGPVAAGRRRTLGAPALLAFVLVAAGLVVWQFLSNATLFFCNADEIGRRSECSGDKRFRLQGTVVKGTVVEGTPTTFEVAYNGTSIPVRMGAEPNGIFREDIPVVVEGRMVGATFEGDRLLVKHDQKYIEKNPTRVKDYGET